MEHSLVCVALIVVISGINAASWSYDDEAAWANNDAACGSIRQSPIALNTDEAENKYIPPVTFYNIKSSGTATITNNGHSADVVLEKNVNVPEISGGPLQLDQRYVLQGLHFHWGPNDTVGSEHIVNGKHFAMEMHLVFLNKKYPNLDEALKRVDGLAVVGRFFETHDGEMFAPLKPISNAISFTKKVDTSIDISNFKLGNFLEDILAPENQVFFIYKGSLTTPPCSEVVDWISFPQPILITSAQLVEFRNLEDGKGNLMLNNYRSLQDLNGREVSLRSPQF